MPKRHQGVVKIGGAMKPIGELGVSDVVAMPLAEFEKRFGFRPVDALEKKFFAATGKRPDAMQRAAIEAGILEPPKTDYSQVVME
jgi:hypothetical protein